MFAPVYKVLGRISAVRNISNEIIVLERVVSRRQGALRRYAAIEERRRGSEKYHERCLNKETYVCKTLELLRTGA